MLGLALALYVLAFVVGGLLLRVLVPADRLSEAVLATLEQSLGRELSVESIQFGLFRGITLNGVRMTTPAGGDSIAFPIRSATAERFVLHYRLRSLFKRRLEITEVSLHNPRLELFFSGPSATMPAATPQDSLPRAVSVPVSVALQRLEIRDAHCTVTIATDTSRLEFGLAGLTFVASKLYLPRGKGEAWHQATGKIALTCDKAPLFFRQELASAGRTEVKCLLDLQLAAESRGLADVEARLLIAAHRGQVQLSGGPAFSGTLPSVEITTTLRGNVPQGEFLVDRLSLGLGGQELLECRGQLSSLGSQPKVHAEVVEGEISLGKLLATVRPLLTETAFAGLLPERLSGRLSFAGTSLDWAFPSLAGGSSLDANAAVDLRDLSLVVRDVATVEHLTLSARWAASADSAGLRTGGASASLAFDQVRYNSPGLPMSAFRGKLELKALAGERLSSLITDFTLKVASLMGGELEGEVHLSAGQAAAAWRGNVVMAVRRLPLAPLTAGQVRGSTTSSLAARVRGLSDIGLELTVGVDSLAALLQGREQSLSPLELTALGKLRTNVRFDAVTVDSLLLQLADMVSARLAGSFGLQDERFSFTLHDLTLHHRPLPRLLPVELGEQIGVISLAGATHVRGSASGQLLPDNSRFEVQGSVSSSIGASLPALGLQVSGVRLGAELAMTPSLARATIEARLDTAIIAQMRAAPITGSGARFEVSLPELQSLVLTRGELWVPAFAAKGELSGHMAPGAAGPTGAVDVAFSLDATDTVHVTDTVSLLGRVLAKAKLRMDGSVAGVEGNISIPGLAVYLPGGTSLKGIRAAIPFSQAFDLQRMELVLSPLERYAYSGPAGAYPSLFAAHFADALPEQGWLTIDRLSFAAYGARNLRMRLFVGGGKLMVPTMLLDAYDGNFGGSLAVEFPALDLARVQYRVEGHLSGLNSALLAARSGQPLEKGIINANFRFTGTGLDVQKGIEVEGFFRITDIGPRVADNLLRSLDPQGLDAGIRSARFFINHGFKPREMSFDLRHAHLYPSIHLSQPWYFPVRVGGGKVELARIPVAFFLQMIKQEAVPTY
ncbi:MAG: hypothetical protein QHJ34_05250 [bacterium]|nr:AsmA family protein [candidate division KSB1 bacterium]MDH7559625.1 hypothetical protein [bacterium]